jgi:Fe-S-cluster containining protein
MGPSSRTAAADLAALRAFHAAVDMEAAALARRHAARLTCRRGCAACCLDDLTVTPVEAERIRRDAPEVLEQEPHAPGACAFLDEQGACRIYAARPYVCRTQGLPLVVFEEDEAGDVDERRDICPLNAEGEPLAELGLDELWLLGPRELILQRIDEHFAGAEAPRVRLRDLFAKPAAQGAAGSSAR